MRRMGQNEGIFLRKKGMTKSLQIFSSFVRCEIMDMYRVPGYEEGRCFPIIFITNCSSWSNAVCSPI